MTPDAIAFMQTVIRAQPDIENVPIAEARRQRRETSYDPTYAPPSGMEINDVVLDEKIPLLGRMYRPAHRSNGALLYLHGGGWVLSPDLYLYDSVVAPLAALSDAAVLSVGYRLAPEHRFPAAAEDARKGFAALTEMADALGVEPGRIGVCGDSAGGNLAASVALMEGNAQGLGPAFAVLIYPVLDHRQGWPSYTQFGTGYALTASQMSFFWSQYLGAADGADPQASPLLATDLSQFPPSAIFTAECDLLRDEGEAFGSRLRDAGASVTVKRVADAFHGCLGSHARFEPGRRLLQDVAMFVRDQICRSA